MDTKSKKAALGARALDPPLTSTQVCTRHPTPTHPPFFTWGPQAWERLGVLASCTPVRMGMGAPGTAAARHDQTRAENLMFRGSPSWAGVPHLLSSTSSPQPCELGPNPLLTRWMGATERQQDRPPAARRNTRALGSQLSIMLCCWYLNHNTSNPCRMSDTTPKPYHTGLHLPLEACLDFPAWL